MIGLRISELKELLTPLFFDLKGAFLQVLPNISVVIITLGRETLYTTMKGLFSQNVQSSVEVVLILQGDIDFKRISRMNRSGLPVHVHKLPHGLGVGYYRNEGIRIASGNVVVFIDDDEWPMNQRWLDLITSPIFTEKCQVTTSGTTIPVTGKYFTDCAGLLGYPGGGNVGFDKIWWVSPDGWTEHLCSGNFAFSSAINLKFNNSMKSGSEDVELGKQLSKRNIPILYVAAATLYHEPRHGIADLARWYFKRGCSLWEYKRNSGISAGQIAEKKRAVKNILSNVLGTRYFPGVFLLFLLQNISFFVGYYFARLMKKF